MGKRYRWVFLTNIKIAQTPDPSQYFKFLASTFVTQVTALASIRLVLESRDRHPTILLALCEAGASSKYFRTPFPEYSVVQKS